MEEKISFYCIETNNLNCIDFHIIKNSVNCVVGSSGSGKSSLVFDTVNAIAQHEYNVMLGNTDDVNQYKVKSFNNLSLSVPLKQLNFNSNPRSTVATYYKIDHYFKSLFSTKFSKESNFFSFNKYTSTCKKCNGLGFEYKPDESIIIDYDSAIVNIPFLTWRGSYKDYFVQLLIEVSSDYGISINIPFRELSKEKQDFLLYGESLKKYKVSFAQGKRKRVKTEKYIGVIKQLDKQLKIGNADAIKYAQRTVCSRCNGTRFSKELGNYKIYNKSIGEIYQLTMTELKDWVSYILNENEENAVLLENVMNFIDKLISVKLEYISLNRSISSLSGGEFQRLRLSQLLRSQLNDVLYILDEPLSSLHESEKKTIIEEIFSLKSRNTLLVIEHDENFIQKCENVTALGPLGGKFGGKIIELSYYYSLNQKVMLMKPENFNRTIKIESNYNINNVKPFNIQIPLQCCIGVCGVSGSGKTTFCKELLPKFLQSYKYISQKPIRGNSYSIVASYIDAVESIRGLFANENSISKSAFSNFHSSEGACKECKGIGKIFVEDYNYKYSYECPVCEGKKFSKESLTYLYKGLNIHEVLSLEISEAAQFFSEHSYLCNLMTKAINIGLGYLKLNQLVETLSGGENQRIKLIKHINFFSANQIIALDEPYQGLNNSEIYKVMNVIRNYCEQGNTVLIIEHNIYALEMCDYIIEFGIGSGVNGGRIIYSGVLSDINRSELSIIKSFFSK